MEKQLNRMCSSSREALSRRGDTSGARQRKDVPSLSHRGQQSHIQ